MTVNISPLAAISFIGLVGTAAAAPLPITGGASAFIYGHNVYSRFLPGSYIIAPGATDGGSQAPAGSTVQEASSVASPVTADIVTEPSVQTSVSSAPASPSVLDFAPSATQGGTEGAVIDGTNGSVAGSPTGVGAVPLPPALSLFGVAVLGLAMVGGCRRRRTAKI